MRFFRLFATSYRKNGEADYVTYEAQLLGERACATQWNPIPIPWIDARPARFEVHFLGTAHHFSGSLHAPLMLPLVIWMLKTRARWELEF